MSRVIKYAALHSTPLIIDNAQVIKPLEVVEEIPDLLPQHDLLAISEEKSKEIIAQANQQAQECLCAAQEQIEEMKQAAHDAGYKQGYDEGYVKGQNEAEVKNQQIIDQSIQQAQDTLEVAQQQAQEMILSAERQIIDIALSVARKILARELEENPVVILPIVEEALEKVKDQEKIIIRVNAEDYQFVMQAKRDFQMIVGRDDVLTISVDPTIALGSCMIDTPYGTVDARLDTKLEMVEKALRDVLP